MEEKINNITDFIGKAASAFGGISENGKVTPYDKAMEVEFSSSGGKRTVSLGRRLT